MWVLYDHIYLINPNQIWTGEASQPAPPGHFPGGNRNHCSAKRPGRRGTGGARTGGFTGLLFLRRFRNLCRNQISRRFSPMTES